MSNVEVEEKKENTIHLLVSSKLILKRMIDVQNKNIVNNEEFFIMRIANLSYAENYYKGVCNRGHDSGLHMKIIQCVLSFETIGQNY